MKKLKLSLIAITIVVSVCSLIIAFRLLNPSPPRVLSMSTGPEGSAYAEYARQYQNILAESGVRLDLQPSGGARENLVRMAQGNSDVGFVSMGTPDAEQAPELRSLGALFLEPMWIFTSDEDIGKGDVVSLSGKRISIGPSGSRSHAAAHSLFQLLHLSPGDLDLLELNPATAAAQLKAGALDAAIMVSNLVTPVVGELLSTEGIVLVDFARADAYIALFPELRKLVVPAGVGSLALNLPAKDTRILAFTSILAVREGLHPSVQALLLDAASRIHNRHDLFHNEGTYPAPVAYRIPLSDSALGYYDDGLPLLLRYLPFWLAVLVMQLLVAAIPLFGIVYPMLKLMPSAFAWAMRRQIYSVYLQLRRIDRELENSSMEELHQAEKTLNDLERKVTTARIPVSYATNLFALKAHVGAVLGRVQDEKASRKNA